MKSGRGPGRGLELAAMRHVMRLQQESLSQLMNGPIRQKLGDIPTDVTWGGACIYTLFDGDLISAQYTCIVYLMQNVFFSAGCMIVCVSLIVCMYVCMYVVGISDGVLFMTMHPFTLHYNYGHTEM